MPDDRYDIPDIPDEDAGGRGGDTRRRSRRPRRWLWLLIGVAIGVAAALLFPRYLGPYLPDFFGFDRTEIRGQVVETSREEGRLLLTVDSEQGAMLVTFHQRVPEIDLLVARGDSIFLRAPESRPFLEDPELVGVRKGRWGPPGGPARPDTAAPPDTGSTRDTASARDTAASPPPSTPVTPDTGAGGAPRGDTGADPAGAGPSAATDSAGS